MLAATRRWLSTLHGPVVHTVAEKLNGMLSPRGSVSAEVDNEELKRFLRCEVMPLLEGTAYDNALQSELTKRDLCLLCRESAYSAAILKANPKGKFVQMLVTFIREDEKRMDFLKRMTTTQASKVIEYLTFVQLDKKDEDCFAILVSRVNFRNLQNVSRIMFCFSERGYSHLNITFVVPAYTGDKWSSKLLTESPRYTPAAEAVRILRALSKSTRMFVEKHFPAAGAKRIEDSDEFPHSSFHLFRNNLIEFIISNAGDLRGAHWVNCCRALLNFSPCVQKLTGLESSEVAQALRITGKSFVSSDCLTCTDIAEYTILKVFEHVEAHEQDLKATASNNVEKESRNNLDAVREAFDCNPSDLLKLLRQLTALPSSPENNARIETLVRSLVRGSGNLSFTNIVKLLRVVRSLSSFPAVTKMAGTLVRTGGKKLLQRPPKDVLKREKFEDIVQFAIIIYACRLRDAPEFLEFLRVSAPLISPKELSLEYVVSFLNCLSILKVRKSDSDTTLFLVNKVVENTQEQHPLLSSNPEQAVKLYRAFALQGILPPLRFLHGILGPAGVPTTSTNLQMAGAVTIFDISRSLAFTIKRCRESKRADIEKAAWEIGVAGTVLPQLISWNERMLASSNTSDVEYVPLSWRCAFETLGLFFDVLLDHHPYDVLVARMTSTYDAMKHLLLSAAACTGKQLAALMSLSPSAREHALKRLAFKNNSFIHFLSALLSFEYYIYHAAWQETQFILSQKRKAQEGGATDPLKGSEEKLSRPLNALLQDFVSDFLHKIPDGGSGPMQVVESILAYSGDAAPLLDRNQTLEITTHLPFAISLVINPGPVNEYFMEKSYSTLLSGGAAEEK
eukprot:gene8724-6130_t